MYFFRVAVDIVELIRTEVTYLNVGTGVAPVFVHGPKSFQNLKSDKLDLNNGVVYLDEPITSNDKSETSGAYTEAFPLIIVFGMKIPVANFTDFDGAQRAAINQCKSLRFQLVNRLREWTDENGTTLKIDSLRTVELFNFFDKNITGVALFLTITVTSGDSVCIVIRGCTDPAALNYNAEATEENGTCLFAPVPVEGCMDEDATNYNALATLDDGSCVYAGAVLGCTDPLANNYNAAATQDDGTCEYDPVPGAPNYIDIICSTYTVVSDTEYAPGLFFDSYEQTCNANTNKPVLISLHPGGGTKTSFDVVKYAKDFASRGYLGIAASYGETAPYTTARQKQNIANLCALIRYLRANSVALGIKKENIFIIGISAGALTSLGTGVAANDLDADVAYWDNAVNLLNPSESSKPLATATQSGAIINAMAAYINAGDVPNYFYHGTLDTTMAYTQAISNYNAQIAAGIASELVPYPGEFHGVGSHHDEIILGGDLLLDGVTVDIGIVQKFANMLVP